MNLFNRKNETFTIYFFRAAEEHNCLGINAIIGDHESNNLLIGIDKDGLWKFDINEKAFVKYKAGSNQNFDKKIGWIQSFYKSRDGKIWMASGRYPTCLQPADSGIKSYIEFPKLKIIYTKVRVIHTAM